MSDKHEVYASRTYIWIVLMLALILGKGFFAYYVVADQGQPTWDYRPVGDLPAQSPYAAYQLLPNPQHVRGDKGE